MTKFVSIPLAAALAVGLALAIQGAINSALSRNLGSTRAAFFSVIITATTVFIVLLLRPDRGSFAGLATTPWWALAGGLFGAVALLGIIVAVPRIGVAVTTGAIVAGQVLAAAVIDNFGLLGVAVRPLNAGRLAGLVLLILAMILVTRG